MIRFQKILNESFSPQLVQTDILTVTNITKSVGVKMSELW